MEIYNKKYTDKTKIAFTLAEVLVTLGIIGIVASMSMSTLISEYQKKVTVEKLKRFDSIMEQSIILAENEHGLSEDWVFTDSQIKSGSALQAWFKEYLGPNIKTLSDEVQTISYKVAFADGSGFNAYIATPKTLHFFYCTEYKYCASESFDGRRTFLFTMDNGKFFTSSHYFQNISRENLLKACKYGNSDDATVSSKGRRHACTRLIEIDDWTIAKDYPWEQTMLQK